MKELFTDLFQYSHHYNQKLLELLLTHPDKVSDKAKRLVSHILNAHHIWIARINKVPADVMVWEVHDLYMLAAMDKVNYEKSLEVLNREIWNQVVDYNNSRGELFSNTVRDILFHVINHSTYHRAQIATELKLAGIEPLNTDYIFYKR
jgi:uncharacterized damage-inducible protein DinB